jgi:hypothetical protein
MSKPHIGSFRFGRIVVDGAAYNKDLIILPDKVLPNWWRDEGHTLSMNDLQPVLDAAPEVLVIGKGVFGRLEVPVATYRALEAAGLELVVLRTDKACQRYNELSDRRSVSAALHLSC